VTAYEEPLGVREIETPFTNVMDDSPSVFRVLQDPVNKRMFFALAAALLVGFLMLGLRPMTAASAPRTVQRSGIEKAAATAGGGPFEQSLGNQSPGIELRPIFAPEVLYWKDKILTWSAAYGVDPNIAATIMQVESCGDPQAVSVAGARGLFQVMPFHFAEGEDPLDADTNARRGLTYFADRLAQTGGDVGRAFAGYNGGHVAADGNWNSWAAETQRYYVWTTGIYGDVQSGAEQSPTLEEWMAAGGASLCQQAASRLGLN
jgi:soluble lytic murein transglycosylase-like protein